MRFRFLATLGLLAVIPAAMQAQTLAVTADPASDNFTNGSWSMGFEFDVLNAITVTQLGFYDANLDGLAQSHDIGIWDSAGNLLVEGTVDAGTTDPLDNYFRMITVTPTLLAVGTDYRIAAITGVDDYALDSNLEFAPDINYDGDDYCGNTTTLADPASDCGTDGREFLNDISGLTSADFAYGPVTSTPEPATMGLLAMGLVGVGGFARRRRQAGK